MPKEQKIRELDENEYEGLDLVAKMRARGMNAHIDHPQRAFILRSPDDTASLALGEGELAIFSSAENAQGYIKNTGLRGAQLRDYSWDELVEKFGEQFARCIVDHKGEPGFYGTAPLIKDI